MLQIQHVCKEYRTGTLVQKALDDVSLNLRDNEFVAILGPSGSGKTTLLNIIGGLDQYDSGDLIINGISTKQYKDRDWDSYRNHTIGFVFQSYNLIPHQTLLSNVELALTISGIGKAERQRRAREALEKVGLGDQLAKKPNQLSGGQMQRVAIARALVNDPDKLQAEDPTGAVDSTTSVQVMDLLKEVADDRLVVMVTHNPDLAKQYATRIVQLSDGQIRSDTDPYIIEEESLEEATYKNMGKSSMNLWTAINLSFNNLRTKKARTLLTAFAGSIGIIGIALIMALSTGVNNYIYDIEEETLTSYPLTISSTGFDLTSLMAGVSLGGSSEEEEEEEDQINVIDMITTMFSKMDSNDLEALKEYLDSGESGMEPYVNAIEYTYDVTPQIYSLNDGTVRQVNPDSSFSFLGFGSGSSASSLMSSMMSTDVFYQLPEIESLYKDQYEVKAGHWPENYNEIVLVLYSDGSISDFLLYTLGLRDPVELDDMVQQFVDGEDVDAPEILDTYSYDDILGKTFKLVNAADYYKYDSEYEVWTDKSSNKKYIKKLVKKAEDLTIVGIIQAKEDSSSTILSSGLYYPSSLIIHVAEQAAESEIVKSQMDNPDINVLTNEPFGEDSDESAFDMSSLISIDEDALTESFSDSFDLADAFDLSSAFNLDDMDLSSSIDLSDMVNFSNISINLPDMPDMDLDDLMDGITIDASGADLTELATSLLTGYQEYISKNTDISSTSLADSFTAYLSTDSAQTILRESILEMMGDSSSVTVSTDQINELVSDILTSYMNYVGANESTSDGNSDTSTDEGSSSSDTSGEESDGSSSEGSASSGSSGTGSSSAGNATTLTDYLATSEAQTLVQTWISQNITTNTDDISISSDQLQTLTSKLAAGYETYAEENGYLTSSTIMESFTDYLQTDSASSILTKAVSGMVDTDSLSKQIGTALQTYMTSAFSSYGETLADSLETQISSAMTQVMAQVMSQLSSSIEDAMTDMVEEMANSLQDSIGIDADTFMEAFDFNLDSDDLTELLVSMSTATSSTYEGNLETFGYTDFTTPAEIDIYSTDFEAKECVTDILGAYNTRMQDEGKEEQVITYTDTVGTLMSSVTDIIDLISYVLIAFVGISLVVSSIMIGVITYISVLERKKEIGILRAIGASKGNISQVFNAETGIIGLCAGLIGIALALLLTIPGNAIIHYLADSNDVNMVLLPQYAIALILLSVCLTLIGGLIPSRTAAKSDPVTALRTE
ncbi:MAG: ATP-binding cassette domain-containing protein [Clostridiales bacterium]|nr:ATP-binding cassette domain-containing protein [Clostridiales bacterium]